MMSRAEIERLAALAPVAPKVQTRPGENFDLEGFVARHLAGEIAHEGPWQGGWKRVLRQCPFNPDHIDRSAVLIQMASGAVVFRCHHNSCTGNDWRRLREMLEPKVIAPDLVPVRPAKPSATSGNGNGAAHRAEPAQRYKLTDLGLSERLIDRHGHDFRYVHDWKRFVVYDGTRFSLDNTGSVNRMAFETVRNIYAEAAQEEDDTRRTELAKHAVASESDRHISAMLKHAQAGKRIAITPDQFDLDPWLFNCANGTIDLRTAALRPHRREDLLTKRSPVAYDPDALAPIWEAFLDRIMDGRESLIGFLRRAAGYTLTALTIEEVLFFLYGTGRNGKSKYLGALEYVLGDYARPSRPELLLPKKGTEIPNDVARLQGARFVPTVELEDGGKLAEGQVKQLTGGDTITARFLHGEFFSFEPTFKVYLATNHKPVVRGTDNAIWERIRLIPFNVTIPPEERDHELAAKLQAEAPGILTWMVKGCLEWQERGLDPPPEVLLATDSYRVEMDLLGQFLEDCCVLQPRALAPAGALYKAYQEWCTDNGEKWLAQRTFGGYLRDRGFLRDNDPTTRRVIWQGVGLREELP